MEINQERFFRPVTQSHLTPVQVLMPADAYYNLEKFQKIQKDLLGQLGHLGCCSGFDIRYIFQRNFLVNEKLVVVPHNVIPEFQVDTNGFGR